MIWYLTLNEAARERVFAAMRKMQTEADAAYAAARRLSAPSGTIAVGGGEFDALLPAFAIDGFLRALRKGADPDAAGEAAKAELRTAVEKHNSQRPKDQCWQRWAESGADRIPHLIWLVREAEKE